MKKVWITTTLFFLVIFIAWYSVIQLGRKHITPNKPVEKVSSPIKPDKLHPQYWSMNGKSVMLLGGSVEDNLFQLDDVEAQLDLLQSVGGNYVRNTMSSRDEGNLWPFSKNQDEKYDLNNWDDTYWNKFNLFLQACSEREIIVQIELWATFDFYREYWLVNPFNPINNVNYTADRVHLPTEVDTHPTWTENNFFWSVPSQENNLKLLEYQQKYIDKLLSYSLNYNNVIYCMDNETSVTSEWGKFWSLYIKKVARENSKEVYTTEMWDPWNLDHIVHRETSDHPEIYDFVDISQNNHNSGDVHWENGIHQIHRLETNETLRPLNNIKVYGNDGGRHQTTQNAIESFIRNVLFGSASTRFHRPTSGQGLNETAQHVIKSMRSYIDKSDFFNGKPSNHLLKNRSEHEAYCRAIEGSEYAIYFPAGGEIELVLPENIKNISIEWLDILSSRWEALTIISKTNTITIKSPDHKNWMALIKIN